MQDDKKVYVFKQTNMKFTSQKNLEHLPCESCLFRLEFAEVEGRGSLVAGGGGSSGGGNCFAAALCFDVAAAVAVASDGFPIDVRDAVLTTAAIEVAVIPFDGFSAVDVTSDANSSDVGTCVGAHFSCQGLIVASVFYCCKVR